MLAQGPALLRDAVRGGHALGAFSTYNLELTQAIIAGAERVDRPVIVQAGSSAFSYSGLKPLAAIALALAASSRVPVGVHLDHSRDLDEITACIALGYSSVMIDGSGLAFEENISLSRAAVTIAHEAGVWVEGELGAIQGNEDRSVDATPASPRTDPNTVRTFVRETGVDALAVAVGNVHGVTNDPVRIDLALLKAIRDECPAPLVLHGASGLSDVLIRAVIKLGVAKINVNTELRRSYLDGLRSGLDTVSDDSIDAAMRPAREAAEQLVASKLELLWPA
jgi:ketose-bisphosphate aldolase